MRRRLDSLCDVGVDGGAIRVTAENVYHPLPAERWAYFGSMRTSSSSNFGRVVKQAEMLPTVRWTSLSVVACPFVRGKLRNLGQECPRYCGNTAYRGLLV